MVLPGVGAFDDAMRKLKSLKLVETLTELVIERKTPFLGVCVGMQLLFNSSEEGKPEPGLGWLDGNVKKIGKTEGLRIPHMGWNELIISDSPKLLNGIKTNSDTYFLHSFKADCPEEYHLATCDYG